MSVVVVVVGEASVASVGTASVAKVTGTKSTRKAMHLKRPKLAAEKLQHLLSGQADLN